MYSSTSKRYQHAEECRCRRPPVRTQRWILKRCTKIQKIEKIKEDRNRKIEQMNIEHRRSPDRPRQCTSRALAQKWCTLRLANRPQPRPHDMSTTYTTAFDLIPSCTCSPACRSTRPFMPAFDGWRIGHSPERRCTPIHVLVRSVRKNVRPCTANNLM